MPLLAGIFSVSELYGRVEPSGADWLFSENVPAEKCAAQLHTTCLSSPAKTAVLSILMGGGRWVEIKTHANPLYQHLIVTAERKF